MVKRFVMEYLSTWGKSLKIGGCHFRHSRMQPGCLKINSTVSVWEKKREKMEKKLWEGCVRWRWLGVVADSCEEARQVGWERPAQVPRQVRSRTSKGGKLTPISRARSLPSSSMMLQGKACLLSLPGALLPPTPAFCSARPPLILRREKKRNILLLTLLHLLTSQNPSPPLSPLSPSPSHFPSRPLAPRPPLKNPDLLLPHCSPPLGRQGSTDWWCVSSWEGDGQVAAALPEKPGLVEVGALSLD